MTKLFIGLLKLVVGLLIFIFLVVCTTEEVNELNIELDYSTLDVMNKKGF